MMDNNGARDTAISGEVQGVEAPEAKECVWCDRAFAVFGICMGLVFLYISVDILMGSRVSTALSGGTGGDEDD